MFLVIFITHLEIQLGLMKGQKYSWIFPLCFESVWPKWFVYFTKIEVVLCLKFNLICLVLGQQLGSCDGWSVPPPFLPPCVKLHFFPGKCWQQCLLPFHLRERLETHLGEKKYGSVANLTRRVSKLNWQNSEQSIQRCIVDLCSCCWSVSSCLLKHFPFILYFTKTWLCFLAVLEFGNPRNLFLLSCK